MYNRRSYFRGGRVNYGLGGALLKVGSNLAQGKGFGSGALQGVGKAAITPGSAIGAGAELAGGLLQKSDNPLAQKIGKGLDVASNFAPGGGGIKGAVGDVAGMIGQNQATGAGPGAAGAAGAVGNALGGVAGQLAQNFLGQARGGKVGLIKAEGGVNTGAAGGYVSMEDGGTGDPIKDGGPFSSAQAQIEQNLSPLRGNLLSQIESDPKKMAWAQENIPGGLENATVYQLSRAADPQHSATQTDRLSRLARNANLPVATETANLYSRMNSGKFNVDVMDQAMLDRGYDGEAGDIFATGVVQGKIPLGAMISADTKDLGTIDDAGRFNFKVFDVPSGAEFLETNRRRIKGDGSIKGDNTDDLTWHAQLGRGDRRVVSPEADTPDPVIPEITETRDPLDPVAVLRKIGPGPLPVNRPRPKLQGGVRLIKDPVEDPVPTSDPGLGRFDIGALEPMLSDYLGSTEINRATGPYGTIQEDIEARIRAQQLAAMLRKINGGQ